MVANRHEDIRRSPFLPQQTDAGKDIFYLLSAIEELVQQGQPVPGGEMKMINLTEILFLMDQIRGVITKREPPPVNPELELLSPAELERRAAALMAEGRRKAEAILADTELDKLGAHHSARMIAQAQEEASRIIADADAYATDTLLGLEGQLSSFRQRLLTYIARR